ncbi:hypothetical protein GGH13_004703 [Coemansia sp. S155-1]|nr:hypothetical protein GGH13_004703 [Coemansia sp. S155-1]
MADLKTNIIALVRKIANWFIPRRVLLPTELSPAITRSIKWYQYNCNYSEKDASGCPIVLAVCRRLLDARIPCASRPVGTTGAAETMLASLENIAIQPGSALVHDSVQPADTSQTGKTDRLDVPDVWEVWVFHAVIPESQAIELVPIPSEFQGKRYCDLLRGVLYAIPDNH